MRRERRHSPSSIMETCSNPEVVFEQQVVDKCSLGREVREGVREVDVDLKERDRRFISWASSQGGRERSHQRVCFNLVRALSLPRRLTRWTHHVRRQFSLFVIHYSSTEELGHPSTTSAKKGRREGDQWRDEERTKRPTRRQKRRMDDCDSLQREIMAVSSDSFLSSEPRSEVHRRGDGEERTEVDGLNEERDRSKISDAKKKPVERGEETYSIPVD